MRLSDGMNKATTYLLTYLKSSNLIFCWFLEFNMVAKIQNGCKKGVKFYKLVIELSVYEILPHDAYFYLLERCSVHNQYVFKCSNPILRL